MKKLKINLIFQQIFVVIVLNILLQSNIITLNFVNASSRKVNYYKQENINIDSIIEFGKKLINKPYKYKGYYPWIMDCSGFISYIFHRYGYEIPHTSEGISNIVTNINEFDIAKGDLLFFKGRNINSNNVGHVALVIENNNGKIKMLHSCIRGIKIDEYPDNGYYNIRFIKAGRLPFMCNKINFLENKNDTITIIGVGDIMLGTNYPSKIHLPPHDGKNILLPVKDIIKNADITFGNLEGVFLTDDKPAKPCNNPDVCYRFKMPDHYVNYLKEAGFDVLSIANNHIGDFGAAGKKNTVKILKSAEIYFAGLTEYPYTFFERNGIKYGFCGFAPNEGTININDIKNAKKIVKQLDSICDIVIVSMHTGAEGADYRHITYNDEYFLGQNRGNPYKFAREVIDAGADIVFGHGPHVTRAIDLYKDRFIAYSMGNFATYSRFNLKGVSGIAPIIKVYVNKKGKFLFGEIFSIKQEGEGCPVIDNDNKALKEIITLTASDIHNSPLVIKESGKFYKK